MTFIIYKHYQGYPGKTLTRARYIHNNILDARDAKAVLSRISTALDPDETCSHIFRPVPFRNGDVVPKEWVNKMVNPSVSFVSGRTNYPLRITCINLFILFFKCVCFNILHC